jgi:hypothetical protein
MMRMNLHRCSLMALTAVSVLMLTACAGMTSRKPPIEVFDDMDRQPKYKPQQASGFFGDARTSRVPVPGSIARGQLREDDGYHTGIVNNMYIGKNPLPITREVLLRGQQRYNIYCSPCHDRAGEGKGIVAIRTPSWQPTNLQEDRQKQMADGEIFSIITQGRRSMPAYRFQVPVDDRWAIVSYVRALQRTTNAKLEDIPQELRESLR